MISNTELDTLGGDCLPEQKNILRLKVVMKTALDVARPSVTCDEAADGKASAPYPS